MVYQEFGMVSYTLSQIISRELGYLKMYFFPLIDSYSFLLSHQLSYPNKNPMVK